MNKRQEELMVVSAFIALVAQLRPEAEAAVQLLGLDPDELGQVNTQLAFEALLVLLERLSYSPEDRERLLAVCAEHWNHMQMELQRRASEAAEQE